MRRRTGRSGDARMVMKTQKELKTVEKLRRRERPDSPECRRPKIDGSTTSRIVRTEVGANIVFAGKDVNTSIVQLLVQMLVMK